jgi:hypothetical protein
MRRRRRRRALDVHSRILYDVLMADVMERINLNVPADVRRRLRALAARQGRNEAEVARSLLVAALDQARRDEFYRRVAEAQTPKLRKRTLEILRAFEKLDG